LTSLEHLEEELVVIVRSSAVLQALLRIAGHCLLRAL